MNQTVMVLTIIIRVVPLISLMVSVVLLRLPAFEQVQDILPPGRAFGGALFLRFKAPINAPWL